MSEYLRTIEELKGLDLSRYPHDEVKTKIKSFEKFGLIQMTLHKGKVIIRARPNITGEPSFRTKEELSYVPPQCNTGYRRASTPYQTMFYGGTTPENVRSNELNNARIIASLESSHLLRNNEREGEQVVTFSKWVVTEDVPLIAVCYCKDATMQSSHTKELYEAYHNSMSDIDPDLREKSIAIVEFLADQFAKKDVDPDYKYMISAIFSEIVVSEGFAGVYFPSVRADSKGYNVAISPKFADSCLKLVAAGECTIYKKGEHTMVDNETVCSINDDSIPFTLLPVSQEYHIGRDAILRKLNGSIT